MTCVSPLVMEEYSAGDASAAEERLRVISDIPSVTIAAEKPNHWRLRCLHQMRFQPIARDALQFAIAATRGIDYLIRWNFRHINNTSARTMAGNAVSDFGLLCPVLCSPEELMGEDDA